MTPYCWHELPTPGNIGRRKRAEAMEDRHFPLGRVVQGVKFFPSVPLGKCPPVVIYSAPAPGRCRGCKLEIFLSGCVAHPSASSCAGCCNKAG